MRVLRRADARPRVQVVCWGRDRLARLECAARECSRRTGHAGDESAAPVRHCPNQHQRRRCSDAAGRVGRRGHRRPAIRKPRSGQLPTKTGGSPPITRAVTLSSLPISRRLETSLQVTIVSRWGVLGSVTRTPAGGDLADDARRARKEAELVIALGGLLAEAIARGDGEMTDAMTSDIKAAERIAYDLLGGPEAGLTVAEADARRAPLDERCGRTRPRHSRQPRGRASPPCRRSPGARHVGGDGRCEHSRGPEGEQGRQQLMHRPAVPVVIRPDSRRAVVPPRGPGSHAPAESMTRSSATAPCRSCARSR